MTLLYHSIEQYATYTILLTEKFARKIMSEPRGIALVDPSSHWRQKPISENQMKFMKWKKIPYTNEMTQGEAAMAIDAHETKREKEKAAKRARKAARAIEV